MKPRVLTIRNRVGYAYPRLTISQPMLSTLLLASMVTASALALVYVKDLNRTYTSQQQTAQHQREQLRVEWEALLLEHATLTTQARVQSIAENQLSMHTPKAVDRNLIQP